MQLTHISTSTEVKIQGGHVLFKNSNFYVSFIHQNFPGQGFSIMSNTSCRASRGNIGSTCKGYPEVSLHTSVRAPFQPCAATNFDSFFSESQRFLSMWPCPLPCLIGTEHFYGTISSAWRMSCMMQKLTGLAGTGKVSTRF